MPEIRRGFGLRVCRYHLFFEVQQTVNSRSLHRDHRAPSGIPRLDSSRFCGPTVAPWNHSRKSSPKRIINKIVEKWPKGNLSFESVLGA